MSGLVRLRAIHSVIKNANLIMNNQNIYRFVGTSAEKKTKEIMKPTTAEDFANVKSQKYWVSWGFDDEDERMDRHKAHLNYFLTITLLMVFGGYYLMYLPHVENKDWAQREAYLELRRREELGLPPIDKDYFDPATIILPTDEELGDTPIII